MMNSNWKLYINKPLTIDQPLLEALHEREESRRRRALQSGNGWGIGAIWGLQAFEPGDGTGVGDGWGCGDGYGNGIEYGYGNGWGNGKSAAIW